jgi:Periplasmic binding protein
MGVMGTRRMKVFVAAAVTVAVAVLGLSPAAGQSSSTKPKATEIGVTPTAIHIAVAADVQNPFAPGLFQGSVNGVNAGAAYVNSKAGGGGVAGRKLVVDFIDTHLNANDSRNATITACQNDLALVGGAMLFLSSVADITGCKDQAGQTTGLPDMNSVVTGVPETCAPTSFPSIGASIDCATVTDNPQTFSGNQGQDKWLLSKNKGGLHGPMVVGDDTKDAQRGGTILALASQQAGVKANPSGVVPVSGRDPQSAYTPIVQKMKSDNANFSLMTSAVSSALELRNEATLQGLTSSKIVWECVSCYGDSTVSSNAAAFEGEYQALGFLPFSETKYNPTLAAFVKYVGVKNADQFSAYSFAAVLAFAQAIKAVVAQHGINGITRSTALEGIKSLTNFNAGGMVGAHSFKTGKTTPCFAMVQFKSGKWVRVYPTKPGTFDCTPSNSVDLKANLLGS